MHRPQDVEHDARNERLESHALLLDRADDLAVAPLDAAAMRCGRAKIAMGARSAVFAPLENIGLIIIDEEHEQSYRADNHPPYHAADIARIRVYLNSAVLVLASATPLIEDYMKAKMGVYELIEMPERVRGLNLPETKIVDMKREFVKGNRFPANDPVHG